MATKSNIYPNKGIAKNAVPLFFYQKKEVVKMKYHDKNGVEIKAGMTIRMEDGSLELIYDTTDSYGNPDLGINASNEEYLELHPFASREFYSLCNFDMRYTEIVDDQTVAENNFEQTM